MASTDSNASHVTVLLGFNFPAALHFYAHLLPGK